MGLSCPSPGPPPIPHSGLPVPCSLLSLKTHYHRHPARPVHPGRLSSLPSQSADSCHLPNYPCPTHLPLTGLTSHPSPATGLCDCGWGSPNTAPGQGHYPEEVSLCTCISVHQSPESMYTLATAPGPLPTCLAPQLLPPRDPRAESGEMGTALLLDLSSLDSSRP